MPIAAAKFIKSDEPDFFFMYPALSKTIAACAGLHSQNSSRLLPVLAQIVSQSFHGRVLLPSAVGFLVRR